MQSIWKMNSQDCGIDSGIDSKKIITIIGDSIEERDEINQAWMKIRINIIDNIIEVGSY